jgi:hypothetical protein
VVNDKVNPTLVPKDARQQDRPRRAAS